MSAVATCIILLISWGGPAAQHPGDAKLNLDLSWTVDWPAMEELAAQPLAMPEPELDGHSISERGEALTLSAPHFDGQFEILVARGLLKQRDAGTIVENLNPNNSCPEK